MLLDDACQAILPTGQIARPSVILDSGHPSPTPNARPTNAPSNPTGVDITRTFTPLAPPSDFSIAANGYAVEVVENAQISGGAGAAFAGDSAPFGDTLTVTRITSDQGIVSPGTPIKGDHGVLTLNADGSYDYAASNPLAINSAPPGPHGQRHGHL